MWEQQQGQLQPNADNDGARYLRGLDPFTKKGETNEDN